VIEINGRFGVKKLDNFECWVIVIIDIEQQKTRQELTKDGVLFQKRAIKEIEGLPAESREYNAQLCIEKSPGRTSIILAELWFWPWSRQLRVL